MTFEQWWEKNGPFLEHVSKAGSQRVWEAAKGDIGFEYEPMRTMFEVRERIRECEGKHVQQVAYSTFMDTLTQVCFTCRKIRTTIGWSGNRSWNLETKQGGVNG